MKITKTESIKTSAKATLRVAAYARVSLEKEAMMRSLSAQVNYYSEYIQKHNNWIYAGVFLDESETGIQIWYPFLIIYVFILSYVFFRKFCVISNNVPSRIRLLLIFITL